MEVLGVKKSKVREMSRTAQKIQKFQNPVGGGGGVGGGVEVLGGQKIKSPGSVMNCPEKKVKPRWGVGWRFYG